MAQVYDEPIVVRLTVPVGPYPVGSEFGFDDLAQAIRALGSSAYFEVVRTQDGDPIPPPTPEDMTEAEKQALARARAARLIRGSEFDPLVPGPGEVIVGSADGPVATPVEDIGGDPNAVIGTGVRRIIASFDPNHPLEDGDLLVLLEATNFFTDFSDYNAANWSSPWGAATWTVADDAGATGGKVLRGVATTAARISHLWQSPGTTTDAEIVFKWRASVVSANVTGFLRAGGTEGSEIALIAGYNHTGSHNVRLGGYNNGSWVSLGTTPAAVPVQANTWMVTRMRVSGTTLAFKSWLASDPEPGAWERQEATPSSISAPGMVGFGFLNPATVDFDWVGVAFDGASAPKAGE